MRVRTNPYSKSLATGLRIFAVLMLLPCLVAWELPFTSQRIRGDNDFRDGNYENAITHYSRALESDTGDWILYYNFGTACYHNGQWDDAVEQLTIAANMAENQTVSDGERAYICHNLGLSYLQLDDCENAVINLTKAEDLAPWDEDIGKNTTFATEYCSGAGQDAEQNEGEQEQQGEGNQQDDQQGQADQGESNDENQAEDNSNCEEGQQEGGSGDAQNPDDQSSDSEGEQQNETDQTGDQSENSNEMGGQGEQDETAEQEGEGDQSDEEQADEGRNEDQQNGTQGNAEENQGSDGQNGNAEESGPRERPNDGLNMSDEQIREILDYMSDLEHSRAPRYFHNNPAEGDVLDPDTAWDLFRRFFLGESGSTYEMPDDGIDW